MSAKTKTVLKGFDYMHCDDFAKYLSDMAAKGWHFKEWGAGLKFEKGEPEQAIYAVEVFPKASENDMCPEPNTQEFAEYCESAGWKFIDAKQKFCIFKKTDTNATELYTPEERIHNSLKGTFSVSSITLLVLYGLNAVLRWSSLLTMFESSIFSGSFFFQISVWTLLFVWQLLTLLYAVYKSRKLKKNVRMGEKIYIGNRQDGKYHLNVKDIYVLALIVLLMYYFYIIEHVALFILNVVIIVGTVGFTFVINKVRPERDTSIAIQVVFAVVLSLSVVFSTMMIFMGNEDSNNSENKEVPLIIADYRDCDDAVEETSVYVEQNLFGSKLNYFVHGKEESISYRIYKSEYAWILDKIWEEVVNGKRYNEEVVECTNDWGAQKALRNNLGTYYVRYEKTILVFGDGEEIYLSEEQIGIILDELKLR
ncbi:MAG: DUF2812 domain-containing protein [Lachnospiraceae bacterium]|nr:DUF2812 domain-containing protein [Lachnospiraceae bacterium]